MLLFSPMPQRITRRSRALLAAWALVAIALFSWPFEAWAQGQKDAGAPPAVKADAGAPARADAGAATATSGAGVADAGTTAPNTPGQTGQAGQPGQAGQAAAAGASPGAEPEPSIRLPQTEAEKAEGTLIAQIDVSGNRRVAKEDVLAYLRQKVGVPFNAATLATDVRALWDSGFFDDITVDLVRADRGVNLRFVVRERPGIKTIEFEGNDEIENDKLQEAIEVKPNTILSLPAVRRSVQKIKDAYAEKGYFLADVDYTVEPQKNNEVVVRFKIAEHQPVNVRRVIFVGNYNVPEADLREVMQTGQGGFFAFGSGGPYRQDIFERDVLLLNALYYDKGYLNVQIGTPRVMLTPDREGVELSVTIHEGPRFKIRQLRVYERDADGKEVEPIGGRRALRQLVKARSGDYFNRADVLKDLQAVRTLYRDAGYANVEVDLEPVLDPARQEVDLSIPIRRGPLVNIERIEIKGNTKTKDKVLRREMEIEEGQLFSETRLEDSKKRITALGYFERVDVSTSQGSSSDKIQINFEVTEKATGTFQVGAGFSSVETYIATLQIQQANLFGTGQSLAAQGQLSGLRQVFSLRFFEPYFFDSDWSTSAELFKQLYIFPDFARNSYGVSATFGYGLIQPWLRLSLTGTVQWDEVETGQVSTFFGTGGNLGTTFQRLPLANLFNAGRTVSLRPSIVYDTRDNRLFPTSGIYLLGSTELATQYFGSELQFLKHRVNANFYYPLGGQTAQPGSGFVLKLRTEFGLITSPAAEGVPVFARYYLGGILDVRGYRLRTVGPRLPLNTSLDVNAP
jgi:outer membrane protein insertion porin family